MKKMKPHEERQYIHLSHTFEPVFDSRSRVLILGTFPSVKSRENQFYYGHPQNRFWKLVAALTDSAVPVSAEEKKKLLLLHQIAVWDVIQSCDIIGSSDSTIKNVVPADLSVILKTADIHRIYANGGKAFDLYQKYTFPVTKREIIRLPSSSPANAAFGMERLLREWVQIRQELL